MVGVWPPNDILAVVVRLQFALELDSEFCGRFSCWSSPTKCYDGCQWDVDAQNACLPRELQPKKLLSLRGVVGRCGEHCTTRTVRRIADEAH